MPTPRHNADASFPDESSRWSALRSRIAPWLLPVFLFLTATLFLGGDLGKFNDDYVLHGIDLATGTRNWFFVPYGHGHEFARPIHWHLTAFLQTVFWEHDRVLHILGALLHAAAALTLWRLLRRLITDPLPPIAAALLFMVFPMGMDAVFFFSANCAVWGIICAGGMLLCSARAAQSRSHRPWFLAAAALAFLTPCWYEQPAPWAALTGLAFLAAAPRPMPIPHRLRRAVLLTLLCCAAAGVYLVLLKLTVDDRHRMNADSMTTPAEALPRIHTVAATALDRLSDRSFFMGAFVEGWRRIIEYPLITAAWLFALIITGAAWLRRLPSLNHSPTPDIDEPEIDEPDAHGQPLFRSRPALIILLGAAMVALCLLPAVAVKHQNIEFRMLYAVAAGLAVTLAGLLSIFTSIASSLSLVRPCRIVIASLALFAAVPLAVACVGGQSIFNLRSKTDLDYAHQLRQLVPDPPKDAVFLPLHIDHIPFKTGHVMFDIQRTSLFEIPWSINYMQQVYARPDLTGINLNRWLPALPFTQSTPDALGYRGKQHDENSPLKRDVLNLIPWDRVVPFVIDANGTLRIIRRLHILCPDNRDFTVDLPIINTLSIDNRTSAVDFSIPETHPHFKPIADWKWASTGTSPPIVPRTSWNLTLRAASLRALAPSAPHSHEITTTLRRSRAARHLHFRAAMDDRTVIAPPSPLEDHRYNPPHYRGGGVTIVVSADHILEPLATLTLTPQTDPAHRAWLPLDVTLPPHNKRTTLRIRVDHGPDNDPSYDSVLITPGYVESISPPDAPDAAP